MAKVACHYTMSQEIGPEQGGGVGQTPTGNLAFYATRRREKFEEKQNGSRGANTQWNKLVAKIQKNLDNSIGGEGGVLYF